MLFPPASLSSLSKAPGTTRYLAVLVLATLEAEPYTSALGRAALHGLAEVMEELHDGRRSVDDESPAQVVARYEAIARAEAARAPNPAA